MGNLLRNKWLVAILLLVVLAVAGGYLLLVPDGTEKKKPIVVERPKVAQPDRQESGPGNGAKGAAASAESAPKREPVGTVTQFKGLAFATLDKVKRTLSDGAPLFPGDQIVTGKEARLILKMQDDAVIALGPDSEFVIQEYQFAPKEQTGNGVVDMNRGTVRFSSGKLAKLKDQPFKVVTPVATLGVRGTEGFVRLGDGLGKDREIEVITLQKEILVWMEEAARPAPAPKAALGNLHFSWAWSLVAEAHAADTSKAPHSVKENEKLAGSANKAPEVRKATREELKEAHAATAVRKLSPTAVKALTAQAAKALVEKGAASSLAAAEAMLAKNPEAVKELVDQAEKKLEKELEKELDKRLDQQEKLDKLEASLKKELGEEGYAKVKAAEEQKAAKVQELQEQKEEKLKATLGDDKLVEAVQEIESSRDAERAALAADAATALAQAGDDAKKQAEIKANLDKQLAALDKRTTEQLQQTLGSERAQQVTAIAAETATQVSNAASDFARQVNGAVPAAQQAVFNRLQSERSQLQEAIATSLDPQSLSRTSGQLQEQIIQSSADQVSAFATQVATEIKNGSTLEQSLQNRAEQAREALRQEAQSHGVDLATAQKQEQESRQTAATPTPATTAPAETQTGRDGSAATTPSGGEIKTDGKPASETATAKPDTETATRPTSKSATAATTTIPQAPSTTTDPATGLPAGSGSATPSTTTTTVTPSSASNNLPTIQPQTFTVDENAPVGTVIGQLVAADVDRVDQGRLTFSLSDTSVIAVDENSGMLSVANGTKLDYETTPVLTLDVTVRDRSLAAATATIEIQLNNINDPPVGVNDTGTAVEAGGTGNATAGSNATGNVLANDSDPDATTTTLMVTAVQGSGATGAVGAPVAGAYGVLTVSANGDYVYVVDETLAAVQALKPGQTLSDPFIYTLSDGALTGTATLTILVQGGNDAPVAVDDAKIVVRAGTTGAAASVLANALTNDTDPENDTLTVTAMRPVDSAPDGTGLGVNLPGLYGTMTMRGNGDYSYTVNERSSAVRTLQTGRSLTDQFIYTVSDGALTSQATISIVIQPGGTNGAPVAMNDSATAVEAGGTNNGTPGSDATGNLLANDLDLASTTLNLTAIRLGAEKGSGDAGVVGRSLTGQYGALTVRANGSFQYVVNNDLAAVETLKSGQSLSESFNYTVTDGTYTDTGVLTVTIQGADDAPVVVDDTGLAGVDGNVLTNDTDREGDGLSVTAIRTGEVEGSGQSGTFGVALAGAYGALTMQTDGGYSYVVNTTSPAVQALTTGQTLTDRFNYTVSDGMFTDQAVLSIVIQPQSSAAPPVAVNDDVTASEAGGTENGTVGTPASGNLLANDLDADTPTLTLAAIRLGGEKGSGSAGTLGMPLAGQYGQLTVGADGAFTYAVNETLPAVEALKRDQTLVERFNYTVTDGTSSDSAVLTITIQGTNDAPVATDDAEILAKAGNGRNVQAATVAGNALINDRDVEGDTLRATFLRASETTGNGTPITVGTSVTGTYGALTMTASGNYRYTVNEDATAVRNLRSGQTLLDRFVYTVSDGELTAQATVTIAIQSGGSAGAPVALNDTATAVEAGGTRNGTVGSDATGNLLTNDLDLNSRTLTLSAIRTGDVEGSGVEGGVGTALAGQYGALTVQANGSFRYVVNNALAAVEALKPGESLTESFNYTVTDGALTDIGVLTLTIEGAGDAPVATADAGLATRGSEAVPGKVSGNLLQNDTDPEGDTLTVTALRTGAVEGSGTEGVVGTALTGAYGVLTVTANGGYDYTINESLAVVKALTPGQSLTDSFTYTVSDGALSARAGVSITIQSGYGAPVAVDDTATANEAGGVANGTPGSDAVGNLLANDTGVSSSSLTVSAIRLGGVEGSGSAGTLGAALTGQYGALTVGFDGQFRYVVNQSAATIEALKSGDTLTDLFNYTMTDGSVTDMAVLTIVIQGANDAPTVTSAGSVSVAENSTESFYTATATDPESGTIAWSLSGVDAERFAIDPATGALRFLVAPDFETPADANGDNVYEVTVIATDNGATPLSGSRAVAVTLTNVNDPPTIAAPSSVSASEDTPLVLSFTVADPDAGTGIMQATLAVTNGTLALNPDSGVTITAGGSGTAGMTLTGTLIQLNAALSRLTYQGSLEYAGQEILTLTVDDQGNTGAGGARNATAMVMFEVAAVNDAPTVAAPATIVASEDQAAAISGFAVNDVDAGTNPLEVTLEALHGTVSLAANSGVTVTAGADHAARVVFTGTLTQLNAALATVTYQGTLNYAGSESLTLTVSDQGNTGSGGARSATVTRTFTVAAVNDAPVAADDSRIVAKSGNAVAPGSGSGNVLTNDADVESDPLSVTAIRTGAIEGSGTAGTPGVALAGAYGSLTLGANGDYVYTVNESAAAVQALRTGQTLLDVFNYTVSDGLLTDTALLTVAIQEGGSTGAPVAVNDSATAVEAGGTANGTAGSDATGAVLANDLDADSPALTVAAIRLGAVEGSGDAGAVGAPLAGVYGTLTMNGDGTFRYVVNNAAAGVEALKPGQTLTESFNYTVSDGALNDIGVLTITIQGADDAPVAVNDAGLATKAGSGAATAGRASGNVLDNDSDVEGDALSVSAIRVGSDGSGAEGTLGTPLAGAYGSLTMTGNGGYLYVINESDATVQALRSDQTLTDSFRYTVSDGLLTGQAVVTITIQGGNRPPVAVDDTATATEAGGTDNSLPGTTATGNLLANDTDVPSSLLTVSAIRQGAEEGRGAVGSVGSALIGQYGILTVSADGAFSYAANERVTAVNALKPGQSLTEAFNYTVTDGALSDQGVLTVTIQGANDAPVATDDTRIVASAGTGSGVTPATTAGNLLTNDLDPEGDTLTVTALRTGPVEGSGTAGTVGTPLTGAYGTLNLAANGAYVYTVNEAAPEVRALVTGQTLTETFNYTVSDGALTDLAVLTIAIQPGGAAGAPVAVNDQATATEAGGSHNGTPGSGASGNLLANDLDADSPTLTIAAIRQGEVEGSGVAGTIGSPLSGLFGTLTVHANGTFTYVVNDASAMIEALKPGETHTDVFNYTVTDGVLSDTGVLTITIEGADDAPVAVNDAALVTRAGEAAGVAPGHGAGNLLDNDTDAEQDTLTVTAIRTGGTAGSGTAGLLGDSLAGSYGSLTVEANGGYVYTLNESAAAVRALGAGQTLTDRFNYTVSDGRLTDQAVLTVTIQGANAPPVAVNDAAIAVEAGGTANDQPGSAATGNLLANDTDASPNLTVAAIRLGGVAGSGNAGTVGAALAGQYGTLTANADGTFHYVVNDTLAAVEALKPGQSLTDRFNYTVTDGELSAQAVLTVTVQGADDAPVATDDSRIVAKAGTGSGVAAATTSGNVLTNDSDLEGDTLTVTAIRTGSTEGSGTAGTLGTPLAGAYGTLTLATNGGFLYTVNESAPAVQALGDGQTLTDAFNYTVSDGTLTDLAVVTIAIQKGGAAGAPVAVNDTGTAFEAGGVRNGTPGSGAQGNLLANDLDADTPASGLTVAAIRAGGVEGSGTAGTLGTALSGLYGQLIAGANGAFSYVVNESNPAVDALKPGESLEDLFNYTVTDGALSDTGLLTITIQGVNDAPVAVVDTGRATRSASQVAPGHTSGNVLSNDTDPEGNALAVTGIRGGASLGSGTEGSLGAALAGVYGTLNLNGDGSYVYTVNESSPAVRALANDQTLTDSFNYTVSDGSLTDQALLTLTIQGSNEPPVAVDDAATAMEAGGVANGTAGSAATGDLLANDTDADAAASTLLVASIRLGGIEGSGSAGALGQPLTGLYGTLTVQTNGAFRYEVNDSTPAVEALKAGASLTERFNYTVTDGSSSDMGVLTITIQGANDAPTVTSGGSVSVAENATDSFYTATAIDSEGETITWSLSGADADRFAIDPASGALRFLVAPDFENPADANGDNVYEVTVIATDASATPLSGSRNLAVAITNVNEPPTITAPAAVAASEDTPVSLAFTVADPDAADQGMQATLAAANGTLTLNPGSGVTVTAGSSGTAGLTFTGTLAQINTALSNLSYQGGADYAGQEILTLVVDDQGHSGSGGARSATSTVTFEVAAVNDAPTLTAPAAITATEDVDATIRGFAVNDVDAGTHALEATLELLHGKITLAANSGVTLTSGTNGSARLVFTGTLVQLNSALSALTYRGNTDYHGPETLTLTVSDQGFTGSGGAKSATTSVNFTVISVNDDPVASDGTLTVTEDVTTTGTLIASDVDGDFLDYTLVTQATKGTVTITDTRSGAYRYVPNADANGSDTFTFRVQDGTVFSNTATITVTITPVNDTPVAAAGTLTVTEDVSATGTLSASDVDGDSLTYSVVTQGAKGTVTITNAATGAFNYVPNANANGSDTFTFKANDGTVDSTPATITVTITPVNDTPVAVDAPLTVTEDVTATGTLSASDVDGDTLTYSVVTQGAKGTVTITNAATGAFNYVPNADANGSDTFTFKVNDGTVDSNTATITVTITPVNDAPVISGAPVPATVVDGTPGTITGFSVADVDAGSGALQATISVGHGTVSLASVTGLTFTSGGNNTASMVFTGNLTDLNAAIATLTFTSTPAYAGTDTLSLGISDQGNTGSGGAQSAIPATVNLTIVSGAPTDITLSNLSVYEYADPGSHVGLLGAVDPEVGDTFTYTITANSVGNLFAIRTQGTNAYLVVNDPATPTQGSYSITIQVADSQARTFTKNFTITVLATPFDLNSAADVDTPALVKSTAETLFKNILLTLSAPSSTKVLSNADLRALILGKLNQQFSSGGSFTYNINDVVKRLTVEVKPVDDPTVIRILARVGVINAMYNRLPTTARATFDSLFNSFAPYATDYTTDVRIRLVPVLAGAQLGIDAANSTVEVLNLQMVPNVSMSVSSLLATYNAALGDLKSSGGLTFFTGGGGSGPSIHVLTSTLGLTHSQAGALQKSLQTTAAGNGVTDTYVPGGDSKTIPTSQRFDYYLPGMINSISLGTGSVTLNR
ncbi:MAG: tandem-95 repeat protein [Magnetococcales bacterium]|nr:tandem-95 repeat protein [Magnetococcales bacterium]